MTIIRELAVGVALLAMAAGGVSPAVANADPDVPSGPYTLTYSGGNRTVDWVFTPCGAGCTSAASQDDIAHVDNWKFHLDGTTWTFSGPGTIACHDEQIPAQLAYSFDAASLAGSGTATLTAKPCGSAAPGVSATKQFQLTKAG